MKEWGTCNKSWKVQINKNSLDCYYVKNYVAMCFDSFGVEYIKRFIGNIITKANIYRTKAYGSIMCGYFCIGFSNFMLNNKSLPGLNEKLFSVISIEN